MTFPMEYWILVLGLSWAAALQHRYDGDRVVRVTLDGTQQWETLQNIMDSLIPMEEQDVWREPSGGFQGADIHIPAQYYSTFTAELERINLIYNVTIPDIQRLIDDERNSLIQERRRRRKRRDTDDFTDSIIGTYPNLEEIYSWLNHLNATYPDKVDLWRIGATYERNDLLLLKIGDRNVRRPGIWLDSALHAREWVAPAVSIYIIHTLLTKYDSDEEIRHFVDSMDWYFLVVANPDGYKFSHSRYRLWRRNTRPVAALCRGVDLNRNFDFMWGGINASPFPCNEVYRGPAPASEIEVIAISNFLVENADVLVTYMSFHSYTQNWLTRWSYSMDEQPEEHEWLMNVSMRAVDAIEAVHGKDYGVGKAGELLYSFTGGSADFAHGVAGIKYSFLIELRDTGVYGFLLPIEEAIPTAEEAWAGVKVVVKETLAHIQREADLPDPDYYYEPAAETQHSQSDLHVNQPDTLETNGQESDEEEIHGEDMSIEPGESNAEDDDFTYDSSQDYVEDTTADFDCSHSNDPSGLDCVEDDFLSPDDTFASSNADSILNFPDRNAFNSDNSHVEEAGQHVGSVSAHASHGTAHMLQLLLSFILCVVYIWNR